MRNKNETKYCEHCGTAFNPLYGRPASRYCSRSCYLAARWGSSPDRACQVCGKPADSTGKRNQQFCSFKCRVKSQVGTKNPGRSNRRIAPCAWCGDDVSRPVSDFHSQRVFCNRRCMAEWQSEFANGAAHPRWKGGPPRSYGVGWRQARRNAMDRAGGVCVRCKRKAAQHVHHLLPIRYFDRLEDAHTDGNLIAVCHRCHAIEHRKLRESLPLLDLLQVHR